jgi:DNA-directed RNA polymerase subunit M
MEFCSNCGKRLVYKPKGKMTLYCIKCRKKVEASRKKVIDKKISKIPNSKNDKSDSIVVLDKKSLKLRTLPTVDCECFKCKGKKAETWTLDLGSEDNSQATFFRCTSCSHTWRETD